MSQWVSLFKKEMLEMARNFKWIWVPITFILLGVMDPLTTFYMPQILDAAGGLPEGTVIEIPTPAPVDVLMMSLSQFSTIGVLLIILTSMGAVAGERKSGVAELILVKPVSYGSFITTKWAAMLCLLWVSFLAGYLASWYYISVLFEQIPIVEVFISFAIYGIWLSFVLSVTIFFSSLFKSPGAAGAASLAFVIILSLVSGTLAHIFEWSPAQLMGYAEGVLRTGTLQDHSVSSIVFSVACCNVILMGSTYVFKKKELAS